MSKLNFATLLHTRGAFRSVASLALLVIVPSVALGEWSATIEGRKVLSAGNNFVVGNLMPDGVGGVIVAVEKNDVTPGTKKLVAPRFDIDGNQVWDGLDAFYNTSGIARKVYLFPRDGAAGFRSITTRSPVSVDAFTYQFTNTLVNGLGASQGANSKVESGEAAVLDNSGNICVALYNTAARAINASTNASNSIAIPLGKGMAKDFSAAPKATANGALFSYTRYTEFPETPSEIFAYASDGAFPPVITALKRVEDQAAESQSNSKLAGLAGGNFMINWIGTLAGRNVLYAKVLNTDGDAAGPARSVATDVTNYVTAPSNFGLPLFAYVNRDTSVVPPTESLFAGLVDPTTGLHLSLPIVTAAGVKVKTIRQEPSGEVTVVYSVPAGDGTALKAQRYSTAGTMLWEANVAELGRAPEEKIRNYPNTFVAEGTGGALYFLTRRDAMNSEATEFSLARLRPDGKLGNEAIAAPANVAATSLAAGNVVLEWDDVASNETSYLVARVGSDAPGYTILATLPGDTKTYTDTTAAAGIQYYYTVVAYRAQSGEYALSAALPVYISP